MTTVIPENPYMTQISQPPPAEQSVQTAAIVNPYAHLYVRPSDPYETKLEKLQGVLDKYEISITQKQELMVLLDHEIVFLCDDSGSMRTIDHNSRLTRWAELKQTISTLVEISCFLDSDGVDIHFLNRESVMGVTSPDNSQFQLAFSTEPRGTTPLCNAINQKILPRYESGTKDILLVIATDGEPDTGPKEFKKLVEEIINKRKTRRNYKFQIMACTSNEREVRWLNAFDEKFTKVDVTDDYMTERLQVLRAGKYRHFNKADYVVKALLGPVVARFDNLDEAQRKQQQPIRVYKESDGCNCVIA